MVVVFGPDEVHGAQHTRIATTTEYRQAFPYTGLPSKVRRDVVDYATRNILTPLAETTTEYCDKLSGQGLPCAPPTGEGPSANGSLLTRFVRPTSVVDMSYIVPSATLAVGGGGRSTLKVTSTFTHDRQGNPTETTVTTSTGELSQGEETYEKKTVNIYGPPGSGEERLGKVTMSTVTSRRVLPQDCLATPITHVTRFQYGVVNRFQSPITAGLTMNTLGLQKTIIEPGAGAPIELHTAYEYDRFGNVIKTTACASEFESCGLPGATGASDLPYRITQVSYDPGEFGVAGNTGHLWTLEYGEGRYPVKTTNAMGHVEYSAYDVRFGKLMQQTGPNGVSTCKEYDFLGRSTRDIDRCGPAGELITTIQRFTPADAATGRLKVVTATTPPAGSPTWTYLDALQRSSMTLTRGFDGQYAKAITTYNALGRPFQATKPYLSGAPDFIIGAEALSEYTYYDAIGRVEQVSQVLGVIDGTATSPFSELTGVSTVYDGPGIKTTRTVNNETRTRFETKNALGKLASVTENNVTLSFTYDADGNLTDTASPAEVCNPPPASLAGTVVHHSYDLRGRKQASHDPDLGDWSYQYDGFGDLVVQTDAKGRPTSLTYDVLGRMVQRDDDSGTARWIYDAAPNGVGKLAAMVGPSDTRLAGACQLEFAPAPAAGQNQAGRSYHYTAFGQVEEVTDCADGNAFVTTYGYDPFGRPSVTRYPEVKGSRFAVRNVYTAAGYLHYVADDADGTLIWAGRARNAAGQVTDELLRNGVQTTSVLNGATGWLLGRTSTARADEWTVIQDWANRFDEAGNLRRRLRMDAVTAADSAETFEYDALNRLTSSDVQVPTLAYDAKESYDFDAFGNLLTKAGKTYKYGTGCMAGGRAAGAHALCQVDNGPIYNYDANGNVVSAGDRTVQWNATNKATRITGGTGAATQTADFIYGADGQRVVQVDGVGDGPLGSPSNSTQSRTVYVGLGATGKSVYERTTRGSKVEHTHFIYAGAAHGGSAFAIRVVREDTSSPSVTPTTEYQYHHFDHLGSVTAMSDYRGRVTSAASEGAAATIFGYDPWGARRSPDGRAADPATFASTTGNRGFTDHEAIPSLGLVNMNGRIYDPLVGRFLSPDPNVQFASDLQSYNRYSYAANNPLRYTDPTGYFLSGAFDFFVNAIIGMAGLTVCAISGGAACGVVFALIATAYNTTSAIISGAPLDQVVTQNLVGLAAGFLLGSMGAGIGGAIDGGFAGRVIGGALGGGLTSAFMTGLTAGDLGANLLSGAASGALNAALSFGAARANPVSQAERNDSRVAGPDGDRPGSSDDRRNYRRAMEAKQKMSDSRTADRYVGVKLYDPLHLGFAVDTWELGPDGNYIKTGQETFDFSAASLEDIPESIVWKAKGRIVESPGLNLLVPPGFKIASTPAEDIATLYDLRAQVLAPPHYSVTAFNCWYWSLLNLSMSYVLVNWDW